MLYFATKKHGETNSFPVEKEFEPWDHVRAVDFIKEHIKGFEKHSRCGSLESLMVWDGIRITVWPTEIEIEVQKHHILSRRRYWVHKETIDIEPAINDPENAEIKIAKEEENSAIRDFDLITLLTTPEIEEVTFSWKDESDNNILTIQIVLKRELLRLRREDGINELFFEGEGFGYEDLPRLAKLIFEKKAFKLARD